MDKLSMIRSIFIFLGIFLLTNCMPPCPKNIAVHKVITTHAKLTKKKFGFDLVGLGSGGPHKITEFCFLYASYRKVDVNKARRLLFELREDVLNIVNSDESIRPELDHYPFKFEDIDLSIVFFKKNNFGTYIGLPYIASVNHLKKKGRIYYFFEDKQTGHSLGDDYSESYEEALKIIKEERAQGIEAAKRCGFICR